MAFKVVFKLKNQAYEVLNYDFDLKRDVDSKGRPNSQVYGGKLTLEVESTEDTMLLAQAADSNSRISGSVVIFGDGESTLKECRFENGFFCEFGETSGSAGVEPMKIRIVISSKKITYGSATLDNHWPDK